MSKEVETAVVEVVKPTSETKVVEQTTPKAEPTYTQKQQDEAVGKGSAAIQRQLSVSQAETKVAKAEKDAIAAELASYRVASEEALRGATSDYDNLVNQNFEDPAERKTYIADARDKRGAIERERKATKRETDIEQKHLANVREYEQIVMNRKIDETVNTTGITREDLMGCMSEAEVELMGLKFQMAKPKESVVETETPQFETTASSGGGGKGKTPTLEELRASTPWDTQKKVDSGEWKL